jgi:hypothetical protein
LQINALGSPTLRALIALYVTGLVLLDVRQAQTRVTDTLPARCHDALNRLLRVMPLATRLVMRLLIGLVMRLGVAGYLCLDDVIIEKEEPNATLYACDDTAARWPEQRSNTHAGRRARREQPAHGDGRVL